MAIFSKFQVPSVKTESKGSSLSSSIVLHASQSYIFSQVELSGNTSLLKNAAKNITLIRRLFFSGRFSRKNREDIAELNIR